METVAVIPSGKKPFRTGGFWMVMFILLTIQLKGLQKSDNALHHGIHYDSILSLSLLDAPLF